MEYKLKKQEIVIIIIPLIILFLMVLNIGLNMGSIVSYFHREHINEEHWIRIEEELNEIDCKNKNS